MRRILLIIVLCLLAISSTGCKKAQLRRQLKELMSSTIVLPEKISCVYNGEVYPMPDSIRGKAKLLIYIDSTECSKCRISSLARYESLYDMSKENALFELFPLICITNTTREDVLIQLEWQELPFPVYVCEGKESLTALNPFVPALAKLHYMLLNQKNCPIMIGDPVNGEKMMSLFKKQLNTLRNEQ